jgi:hypothetical protein
MGSESSSDCTGSDGDEKMAIDTMRIRRVLPSDYDNEETQCTRNRHRRNRGASKKVVMKSVSCGGYGYAEEAGGNQRDVQLRHSRSLNEDHTLVGEASWREGVSVRVGHPEPRSHADLEAAAELVLAELWGDVSDGEDSELTPGWVSPSSSSEEEEEEEEEKSVVS